MSNLNLKKDFLGTAIAIGLAVTACGGGDELIDSNSLSQTLQNCLPVLPIQVGSSHHPAMALSFPPQTTLNSHYSLISTSDR